MNTQKTLTTGDFTEAENPFLLFEAWLAEAALSETNDPTAMTLATIGDDGAPDARIVLLKGLDDRGFVFYTNYQSRKGEQLARTPLAALVFHWKSLRRQVRVRGRVERVTDAEADAYYATRPRGSQIGAWASAQSRPLESRPVFEAAVKAVTDRYEGQDIPRPPFWSGFRVLPSSFEFWHDRPFRLHDRITFERTGPEAPWQRTRLYP